MAKQLIQACGDPTVDWLTIRNETEPGLGPFFWVPDQPAPEVGLSVQPGGSALITPLLDAVIPSDSAELQGVTLEAALIEHTMSPITRAWTVWQRQGKKNERLSFRIAEWSGYGAGEWDYDRHAAVGDVRACAVEVDESLTWERMLKEVVAAVHGRACPFMDEATGELAFHQVIVAIGAAAPQNVDWEQAALDGIAEIVERARTLGKPICHVWAGNYKEDPAKRTDAGVKHGTVEYINFP